MRQTCLCHSGKLLLMHAVKFLSWPGPLPGFCKVTSIQSRDSRQQCHCTGRHHVLQHDSGGESAVQCPLPAACALHACSTHLLCGESNPGALMLHCLIVGMSPDHCVHLKKSAAIDVATQNMLSACLCMFAQSRLAVSRCHTLIGDCRF